MANTVLEAAVSNVIAAAGLAVMVSIITRLCKSPYLAHTLWLLVLIKLVTPPLWHINIPVIASGGARSTTHSSHAESWEQLSGVAGTDAGVLIADADTRRETKQGPAGSDTANPWQASSAASGPSHSALFGWQPVLLSFWLVVTLGCFMIAATRAVRFNRALRHASPPSSGLHRLAEAVAAQMELHRLPNIRVTDAVVGPLVWPVARRAVVVLPRHLLSQLSDEQVSVILAHEFSHLLRHDSWIRVFEVVVSSVYWWNPLVGWTRNKLRAAEETCCDARVMQLFPRHAVAYSEALLATREFVAGGGLPTPVLASGFRGSVSLKRRVEMILKNEFGGPLSPVMWLALIILSLVILPPAGRMPRAEDNAAESGEAKEGAQDPEIRELLQTLGTAEPMRFQALRRLVELGDKVIEPTRKVLNDNEQPFTRRWQAAKVLGYLKARTSVPDLLKVVEGDDNPVVTRVAVWSLGEIGDATVIGRLKEALEGETDAAVSTSIENAIAVLSGKPNVLVPNLDFESGTHRGGLPNRWGGGGAGYELTVDTEMTHQGKGSVRIKQVDKGGRAGVLTAVAWAKQYHGKRIKFTGYLRALEAQQGGLWMRIDGLKDGQPIPLAIDNMRDRPVQGTTDWKEYAIILDVPADAQRVVFGLTLSGSGTLWGDDLDIEVVGDLGQGPKPTGSVVPQAQAAARTRNLDFEAGARTGGFPSGWAGGGAGYKFALDRQAFHQGGASGRIERVGERGRFGSLTNETAVAPYRGKRIKYTGYLRTREAEHAGLWMRVDGLTDGKRRTLAFDNMHERPVQGTTDWTQYTVVLDVPDDARFITCGFLLMDGGTLWGDDLKIEAVGEIGVGPDVTGLSQEAIDGVNESLRRREEATN